MSIGLRGQDDAHLGFGQHVSYVVWRRFAGLARFGDQFAANLLNFRRRKNVFLQLTRGGYNHFFFGEMLRLAHKRPAIFFFVELWFLERGAGEAPCFARFICFPRFIGLVIFFAFICFFRTRGGGDGSGGKPSSKRRYFSTLRSCSASVLLKIWPPESFATK